MSPVGLMRCFLFEAIKILLMDSTSQQLLPSCIGFKRPFLPTWRQGHCGPILTAHKYTLSLWEYSYSHSGPWVQRHHGPHTYESRKHTFIKLLSKKCFIMNIFLLYVKSQKSQKIDLLIFYWFIGFIYGGNRLIFELGILQGEGPRRAQSLGWTILGNVRLGYTHLELQVLP